MTSEDLGQSFGKAAGAYQQYRFAYPPALHRTIFAGLPPDADALAIDLGAGTGLSAAPLLARFSRVIAIEPDPAMAAKIAPHQRLSVIVSTAEKAVVADDSADLITCGTAFYWMDGPRVLENARRWLKPGAGLAIFRNALPRFPAPLDRLIREEFRDRWDAFRDARLIDEDYSWRTVSGFAGLRGQKRQTIANRRTFDAEQLVGFFTSASYVSAYMRSLNDAAAYGADFLARLRAVLGEGTTGIDCPLELITARRP